MAKEPTIVIYKPSTQSTEEFVVVVNPDEYKKWKDGDTSVALALIVDSFDVFHCPTGHTGKLGKASKQQLEATFDTHKDDEVIKKILETGTVKKGPGLQSKFGDTNLSQGSGDVSSRGATTGR